MNYLASATKVYPQSNLLFDQETGFANPDFKWLLNRIGIATKRHFKKYSEDHVFNVEKELQMRRCFQTDLNFYKNGGASGIEITYQQAMSFLDEYDAMQPKHIFGEVDGNPQEGVALDPIEGWKKEMTLEGYEAALSSPEKAVVAFAKSKWIILACQVNKEMSTYGVKHYLKAS